MSMWQTAHRAPTGRNNPTGARPASASALRVLLVSPLPPPLGGLSVWTGEFLRVAVQHGVDCTIIDTSPGGSRVNAHSRIRVERLRQMASTVRELWRALPGHDVAHLTTTWFWSLAREGIYARMCRVRGVTPVLHIHASTQVTRSLANLSKRRRRLLEWWLRPVACVVVLSDELRTAFAVSLPGQRVVVIENWVDTEQFHPPRVAEPLNRPTATITVLFVGRLTEEKGFVNLAEAVVANPALQLVTIGDRPDRATGQDHDAVGASIAALEATGRHRAIPLASREEIADLYRAADIFALPSWNEGLPLSLLEAMATGLPCVVTPVGGMADLLATCRDTPFALRVDVDDSAALLQALTTLADDATLRALLGSAGRRIAESRYSSRIVFAGLLDLYGEIVGAHPGARRSGEQRAGSMPR